MVGGDNCSYDGYTPKNEGSPHPVPCDGPPRSHNRLGIGDRHDHLICWSGEARRLPRLERERRVALQ
jgi:hypothetical protein